MGVLALTPVIGTLWLHLDLRLKLAMNKALRESRRLSLLADYTGSFPLCMEICFDRKPIEFIEDRVDTGSGQVLDPESLLFPWEMSEILENFSNIELVVTANSTYQDYRLMEYLTNPRVRFIDLLSVPKIDLTPIASKVLSLRHTISDWSLFANLVHLEVTNDLRQKDIEWNIHQLSQLRVLHLFFLDQAQPISLPLLLEELHVEDCKIKLGKQDNLHCLKVLDIMRSTLDPKAVLQIAPMLTLLKTSSTWNSGDITPSIERLFVNLLELSSELLLPYIPTLVSQCSIGQSITHLRLYEFNSAEIDLDDSFPSLTHFSVIEYVGNTLRHKALIQLCFASEVSVRFDLPLLQDLEIYDGVIPSNIPYENLLKLAFMYVRLEEIRLPRSPSLTTLNVLCCEARCLHLDWCPKLQQLYVEDNRFEQLDINHKNIRLIRVSHNPLLKKVVIRSPVEFVDLSNTPRLHYAELPKTVRQVKLERTSTGIVGGPFPLVTQLKCHSSGIIKNFPHLEHLEMIYNFSDLVELPQTLKQLSLRSSAKVDLSCLESMVHLEVLDVISDVVKKHYKLNQSVRKLNLSLMEVPQFDWDGPTKVEFLQIDTGMYYSDDELRQKLRMDLHPSNIVYVCRKNSNQ